MQRITASDLTEKEKNKSWYEKNKEEKILKSKLYYKNNKERILKQRKEKDKLIRKQKRIKPQISCTIDQKSLDFLKDMTIFYSMKKKKVFNYSTTLTTILKFAKEMEHELQDYI